MITKELIEQIYEAANSQRWNDHLRPQQGFTELDKQSHKMVIAYVLAKYEEERGAKVNWLLIIEGGLFEFLHRTVVTDIKPPVYYELRSEYGEKIDHWVIKELKEKLLAVSEEFFLSFEDYILNTPSTCLEKRILKAAHYLATSWEFNIVYNMNKDVVVEIEETKEDILKELQDYGDLLGVQKIAFSSDIKKFINLVAQLRFQRRWAQSPRVPETSVMGHMLIVAILGYFCSRELKASEARTVNNYFCGLFHDLPEVLTRDIISPVKRSVKDLDEQLKEIERKHIKEKILPLIPEKWHQEIKYYIEEEFETRIFKDGQRTNFSSYVVPNEYDKKEYRPTDGRMLKCCDNLAAFVEAVISCRQGTVSRHLLEGIQSINNDITGKKSKGEKDADVLRGIVAGIDFRTILNSFEPDKILDKNRDLLE